MQFLRRLLLIVVTSMWSQLGCAEEWIYLNPFDSKKFFSIDTQRRVITLNHEEHNATDCAEGRLSICIRSDVFEFAFPRERPKKDATWLLGSTKFKVVDDRELHIFGKRENVLIIESKFADAMFSFVYSTRVGLISFSVSQGSLTGTYFVTSEKGFGANQHGSWGESSNPNDEAK